jgi:hypothetical protein
MASRPDIVTIMLGTNDAKDLNWGNYSVGEFGTDYGELIAAVKALPTRPKVRRGRDCNSHARLYIYFTGVGMTVVGLPGEGLRPAAAAGLPAPRNRQPSPCGGHRRGAQGRSPRWGRRRHRLLRRAGSPRHEGEPAILPHPGPLLAF